MLLLVQINYISFEKKQMQLIEWFLIIRISISLLWKATNIFVKVLIKSSIKKKVGKKKIQATRYLAVHILHHYLNLSPAVMIAT